MKEGGDGGRNGGQGLPEVGRLGEARWLDGEEEKEMMKKRKWKYERVCIYIGEW